MALTTVTYIRNQNKILMLHRVKELNDFNEGKWLGVGGHLELGETPQEAALREIKEETGISIDKIVLQGIVTFVYPNKETDYIFVYRADTEITETIITPEGVLQWIAVEEIMNLNLWEGDLLFLPYVLDQSDEIFSVKLVYDENGNLDKYRFD